MSNTSIFKIVTSQEWEIAKNTGFFEGSELDQKDGYIHCSTAEQAPETKDKFFKDMKDLVLLTVDVNQVQKNIKWEESPASGKVYPHIYGILPLSAITKEEKLA
ncbi:MAG: DUF952 domain-containing protein [Chitinophagaceae bacterium]|nr:DUF952 domain-containing protein [Chitinophagaceae bacterium]